MKGNSNRRNRSQQGTVLVFTLVTLAVLGIMIGGLLNGAVAQRRLSERYQVYTQEFAAAELVLTKAFGEISYALKKAGDVNPDALVEQMAAAAVPNFSVDNFEIQKLSDEVGTVPAGEKWSGYNLRRISYRIETTVRRSDARGERLAHPGVSLSQEMQVTFLPLNVFGLFYANDLEINNGQSDFVETGRTHTNANFYYGADGKKQDWKDYVTAVGHMQYGRSPKTPQHGDKGPGVGDGTNTFFNGSEQVTAYNDNAKPKGNTKHDKKYLDWQHYPDDKTWANMAMETWKGYVRDQDMGVAPLNLPWPDIIPSHEVIQPANVNDTAALLQHKFVYKAGLLISLNGSKASAKLPNGTDVSLTYNVGGQDKSIVSTGTFYDARENKTVNAFNIDLAKMGEAGLVPSNGIVYIQNQNTNGVVRVLNGENLPGNSGFTIATPDPLYVQGNYNTVDPVLSMLACDAAYVLSKDWSDQYSRDNSNGNWKNKKPAATAGMTLNASVVTGNVPSIEKKDKVKQYSGGVENFFRFLEDWQKNGVKDFNVTGSLINLYESQKAKAFWNGDFQAAPRRVFNWDPALASNSPPGAPLTFETAKLKWSVTSN